MNGKHAGTTHSHRPGRQAVSSTQPHHKTKAIKGATGWCHAKAAPANKVIADNSSQMPRRINPRSGAGLKVMDAGSSSA